MPLSATPSPNPAAISRKALRPPYCAMRTMVMELAPYPAAKGEPAISVNAPVTKLMENAEMVLA